MASGREALERCGIELVHKRLAAAEADYEARYGQEQK
jgi:hypothetical protein